VSVFSDRRCRFSAVAHTARGALFLAAARISGFAHLPRSVRCVVPDATNVGMALWGTPMRNVRHAGRRGDCVGSGQRPVAARTVRLRQMPLRPVASCSYARPAPVLCRQSDGPDCTKTGRA
jgi:hypothetical protein